MSGFAVLVPNEPPETGHSVATTTSKYEDAEAEARKRAKAGGPGTTVYIESQDENDSDVWSVAYRPEPPRLLSLSPTGEANVEWPVEFRVVHDPSHIHQVFDEDTGEEVERSLVGSPGVLLEEVPESVLQREAAIAATNEGLKKGKKK